MEEVTGKIPHISEYCDFDFYDLVWYFPGVHPSISQDNRALGRWVGVSHRIGSDMCYWIITSDGIPISESTVQHVTRDDMLEPEIMNQIEEFNEALTTRLDDSNFGIAGMGNFGLEDEEFGLPQ
jgi:hypothetical protein